MASLALSRSVQMSSYRLLRQRPALRAFLTVRALDELNSQMVNVAISWHVYAVTHSPISLAYVGLARFAPNFAMALLSGQVADRYDKRKIISLSLLLQTLCSGLFALLLTTSKSLMAPLYLLLVGAGMAQAFLSPALSAILPELVTTVELPHAVAVSSSLFQICTLLGPAVGGVIYALNCPGMFGLAALLYLFAALVLPGMASKPTGERIGPCEQRESPLAGLRYIRSNGLLLGAISLDLFAVLLGGITALLPIFAKDILALGPGGLGLLRCAPGVGAAVVGVVLAHRTIQRQAGKIMLLCVAGFGFATIAFAVSRNFWVSLGALVAAGAFDMVSMVIRQTLVQIATPPTMLGRVSAVEGVFIGASSELGEFESGITAGLFGTVPAALLGGIGTITVVLLWRKIFPELAGADTLVVEELHPVETAEPQPDAL